MNKLVQYGYSSIAWIGAPCKNYAQASTSEETDSQGRFLDFLALWVRHQQSLTPTLQEHRMIPGYNSFSLALARQKKGTKKEIHHLHLTKHQVLQICRPFSEQKLFLQM